ncbi:hypothetical protein ABEF95_000546 [Exophiala dermatitidis]
MVSSYWPPGWPSPNYDNPETRGSPWLFIATLIITAVTLLLRFYSRIFLTRAVGIDDGLIVAGFVLSIGQTFAEYKALTTWGWDRHLWDVPVDRLQHVRLAAWLVELFFILGNACTKVSILMVYRKISSGSHNYWFFRLTWAAIVFTIAYTVGCILELCLACRPLEAYWRSYSPSYTRKYSCVNETAPIVFSAAASVFSDIYSSVLPMLLTRNLNVSRKQRLGLYVVFSAGLITAGIGVARLCFLVRVTTNYRPGPHIRDVTWDGWPTFALTDIEAHIAMIGASAPALKVLYKRYFSHRRPNLHSSVQSNQARRASARAGQTDTKYGASLPPSARFKRPFQASDTLTYDSVSASGAATDCDLENLSLHSMDMDRPSALSPVHAANLQRAESRQWPG